ncbi:hypothetical protein IV203_007293 [Nitzschia inconspicua]|uniref:Uncharacterized protein n=1 Tax=Nitzschia inconspicua TaxID=303405 RepID=A0A9K3KF04_9STRA|nr:hypothetical protein IV203_007293 [Nitzschia inconspicua]
MTTTTSDFPHDPLTPITGRPTSNAIYTLTRQIYANAKTGEAYIVPPNPGPHPDPVAGATNAQITAAANAYTNAVTEYALHKKTMKALLHQLLAAVEPTYYEELEDLTFGYADLAPLTLLTHLKTEYGTITDDDLVANRANLLTTWNPDDPLTTVWTRIRHCIDFATDTTDPISERNAMTLTLAGFVNSGVLMPYINEWERKDDVDKTFPNFRSHFDRANKQRLKELTTKQAGFHAANAVTTPRNNPTITGGAITAENTTLYYCWTHGLSPNPNHTSATCKNRKDKHDPTATLLALNGGCKLINTPAFRRSPPT